MPSNRDVGQPSGRVPPSETQVPEPQLWPLLYDLNGKVTRMDEAVDGLKTRTERLDRRLEVMAKEVQGVSKELSALRGSINTFKWVFGLLIPVGTVVLEMLLKKFLR